MKQYLLLGFLLWLGIGCANDRRAREFYEHQVEKRLPKVPKTFFQKIEDAVQSAIYTAKQTRKILGQELTLQEQKAVIIDTLKKYSKDIKNTEPFKIAAEKILKEYDIELTSEERLQTGIYKPGENPDGIDLEDTQKWTTDIFNASNVDQLLKIVTQIKTKNKRLSSEEKIYLIQDIARRLQGITVSIQEIGKLAQTIRLAELNKELPRNSFEEFKKIVLTVMQSGKDKQKYKQKFYEIEKVLETVERFTQYELERDIDPTVFKTIKNESNMLFTKTSGDSKNSQKLRIFEENNTEKVGEEDRLQRSSTQKYTHKLTNVINTIKNATHYFLKNLLNRVNSWIKRNNYTTFDAVKRLLIHEINYENEKPEFFSNLYTDILKIPQQDRSQALDLLSKAISQRINQGGLEYGEIMKLQNLKNNAENYKMTLPSATRRQPLSGSSNSNLLQQEHEQATSNPDSSGDDENNDGDDAF